MAGTISGNVTDIRNNQPIEGAAVTANPGDHTTMTSGEGTYSLSVDEGTYDFKVTASGFDPFDADGLVVLDGVTTEINVPLWPTEA